MYSNCRSVILSLAVIGLGVTVGGRGADNGVSSSVGNDGPDGSLAASLIAGLTEIAGSPAAYAQARRNCETARRGTRNRRCVQRTPWSFSNGGVANSGPLLTPDARFVVFASRENLDNKNGDRPASDEAEASSDIFRLNLQNGALTRVSVDRAGRLPPRLPRSDGIEPLLPDSSSPAISANGRLVAFATDGVFLPEDSNGSGDVYVKNLKTRQLRLVSTVAGSSRSPAGGVPVVGCTPSSVEFLNSVAMSDNGRFVAFVTFTRLDPDHDNNDLLDVYLKDLRTGDYFLTSFDENGNAGGVSSDAPGEIGVCEDFEFDDSIDSDVEISASGRFVAFSSAAALDSTDGNGQRDVYVWDRLFPDNPPVLASPGAANGILSRIALSGNGRFVAFVSEDALIPGDINEVADVYRFDRKIDDVDRRLLLVSIDAENRQTSSENLSDDVALSANGRFVAFSSDAGDLVLNDTNSGFNADIFVKDLRTAAITRASVDEDGIEPDGRSFSPSLAADGGVIAFLTDDSNLLEPQPGDDVPGDTVVITEVDFATLPIEDIPGDPARAASIGFGFDEFGRSELALRSTIDRQGDQDWFRATLTAGTTYVIDLEGRPSRQGTLDDPLLRILVPKIPGVDQDGLEALDDDGGQGLNARLTYEAQATGTHFISAEGFGNATGTYRLLVREQ